MSALSSLTCGAEPSFKLCNFGFVHFSHSDQVRDDLHERPVDHHRVDHQAADRVQIHRRRHVGRLQSHAW